MMGSELDSVEVTFYSKALEKEVEVDCIYKFYKGRSVTRLDPEEKPERDFHKVIVIECGIDILDELSDEDKDTINEKIDEYLSGGQ